MQNVAYPMYSYSSYSGDDESLMLAEVVKVMFTYFLVQKISFSSYFSRLFFVFLITWNTIIMMLTR